MKIRIAHSPDSDDAFMFYGLASGKVSSPGFEIEHVLSDIETLNRAAFQGTYEITAVSFHAYAHLTDRYILLPHGASMGDKYGPVVVARQGGPNSVKGVRVAVPGELTTAFLTLRLFEPVWAAASVSASVTGPRGPHGATESPSKSLLRMVSTPGVVPSSRVI